MAETKAQWFIPGRDRKPAGPYTTEQVLRALRIGRVTRQTICWREGMADWLPIEQIPEIAPDRGHGPRHRTGAQAFFPEPAHVSSQVVQDHRFRAPYPQPRKKTAEVMTVCLHRIS